MDYEKKYHCSTLEEDEWGESRTLCGISTAFQSWDYPLDFAECEIGPAYHRQKCKECENHPDMPLALLGDLED